MKLKYFKLLIATFIFFTFISCKKTSLDVINLNNPSYSILSNESGIIGFSKGFYQIGFGDQSINSINDGLGYGMLCIVYGFHEGMGDNIFVPWGNNSFKFADNPLWVQLDNGTKVTNPIGKGQISELKLRNDRAFGASNSFLPEWTYMYFLNNSANVLLTNIDGASFSGDVATKKKVLQAWAYWWKGYAYSRIGSMYVAGLKIDAPNATNGAFLTHDNIIVEANANFDKAQAIITTLTSGGTYDAVLQQVIPGYMQFKPDGSTGIPSPAEWIKNINSMKARNLLVNKKKSAMTAADWAQITTFATAGINSPSDYVFIVKTYTNQSESIIDPVQGGGNATGSGTGYTATSDNNTFFPSERLIQDFNLGDKRLTNNFDLLSSAVINKRGRGITFGTRYYLVDGGVSNGAYTYYNSTPNVDNYFLSVSYEENQLMKAEALINTSSVDAGVAIINTVRTFQGAGISSPVGLTLSQANEQLRRERRCALFFRSVAWYDLRRLGMNTSIDGGGVGRTGCVVLDATGAVNSNCTINYAYLSYWDVPQNELDFNAPATGSAAVKSPN